LSTLIFFFELHHLNYSISIKDKSLLFKEHQVSYLYSTFLIFAKICVCLRSSNLEINSRACKWILEVLFEFFKENILQWLKKPKMQPPRIELGPSRNKGALPQVSAAGLAFVYKICICSFIKYQGYSSNFIFFGGGRSHPPGSSTATSARPWRPNTIWGLKRILNWGFLYPSKKFQLKYLIKIYFSSFYFWLK
jgi:hypothetical protein